MNLGEYFAMGGYAAFIWPSYGLAVVLLVAIFGIAARRLRIAERTLDQSPGRPGDEAR
jgi:heme exporter protein D